MAFNALDVGVLYKAKKFEATTSNYEGKVIKGMRVFIEVGDMTCFTYLPKQFTNLKPTTINELSDFIEKGSPPSICYYGTIGSQNVRRIHRFGEGINEKLLQDVAKASLPSHAQLKRGISDLEQSTSPKHVKISTEIPTTSKKVEKTEDNA